MTISLELPADLETRLVTEASQHGLPLPEYVLKLLSKTGQSPSGRMDGAALVAYWQQQGVIGSRAEIADNP